jgi:hypothetical protein
LGYDEDDEDIANQSNGEDDGVQNVDVNLNGRTAFQVIF